MAFGKILRGGSLIVLGAALLVGCERAGSGTVAPALAPGWESNFTTALTRAGAENKLVMVDFYTDWCRWCKKLDETTYSDAKVQEALKRVVPVKLNAEESGREQAERFGVEGYPTIVFLNSGGHEVGRIPGYLSASAFLEEFEQILKRA